MEWADEVFTLMDEGMPEWKARQQVMKIHEEANAESTEDESAQAHRSPLRRLWAAVVRSIPR